MRRSIKIAALCLVLFMCVGLMVSCRGKGSETEGSDDEKAYTFTVVFGDTKKPVEGVQIQICKGDDFCLMPVTTDKDGVAHYALAGENDFGVYDVHIIGGIPEGYTFDNSSVKTNATDKSYTLTLKVSGSESDSLGETDSDSDSDSESNGEKLESDTKKNETTGNQTTSNQGTSSCNHVYANGKCVYCGISEQKNYTVKVVYDSDCVDNSGKSHKSGEAISGVSLVITDQAGSKIYAQGKSDSSGAFHFKAAAISGGYFVRVTGGVPSGFGYDDSYKFWDNSTTTTVGIYMKVSSSGERMPFSPQSLKASTPMKDSISSARADDSFSPEDESYYYYSFTPTKLSDEGMYKVTVRNISGSQTLKIARFNCSIAYIYGTPEQQNSGTEASIEFMIAKDYITDSTGNFAYGNYWLIGVKADGSAKYPVNFEIEITKTRDLVPGKDYPLKETHEISIESGALKADAVTGSNSGKQLVSAPSNATLVKDSKGYYHINSATGPYAMTTLKAPNGMLNDDKEVFFCNINDLTGVEQVCMSEQVTQNGITTIHYYKYYGMLKSYGALCNSDGAYPINDQLLTFLKGYAAQRRMETAANAYLLGVYYYK